MGGGGGGGGGGGVASKSSSMGAVEVVVRAALGLSMKKAAVSRVASS